jgi:hypothetical protein
MLAIAKGKFRFGEDEVVERVIAYVEGAECWNWLDGGL